MNRIENIFSAARARGAASLLPFVVAGHPAADSLGPTLLAMQRAGSAIVEVGIPFSDPIADGPVIAHAMHQALRMGTTPASVLRQVAAVRSQLSIGVVAMVSVSIVHRLGGTAFVTALADAGFDGVIVPDLDVDAAQPLLEAAASRGMAMALLVSPLTPPDRVRKIASLCRGFVYVVARAGVTGEQRGEPDIASVVERVRAATTLPVAVGFGISTPAHVRAVARHADAAIVGSALVRLMGEGDPADAPARAESFVKSLVAALGSPPLTNAGSGEARR